MGSSTNANANALRGYGVRRVYETHPKEDGSASLRLRNQMVELGAKERKAYSELVEWLPTNRAVAELEKAAGMDEGRLLRFAGALVETGLLYRQAEIPPM